MKANTAHPSGDVTPRPETVGAYPWRRLGARLIDRFLFVIVPFFTGIWVFGIYLGMYWRDRLDQFLYGGLVSLVIGALYSAIIEGMLLARFGNTPGRWVAGIRIGDPRGGPLSPEAYRKRSIQAWWRGCGAYFPIVTLLTMLRAHRRLKEKGRSSWDEEADSFVWGKPISSLRGGVLLLLVLFSLVLSR